MNKRNLIDFSVVIVFIACCVTMLIKGIGNKSAAVVFLLIGLVGLFWLVADMFKKSN